MDVIPDYLCVFCDFLWLIPQPLFAAVTNSLARAVGRPSRRTPARRRGHHPVRVLVASSGPDGQVTAASFVPTPSCLAPQAARTKSHDRRRRPLPLGHL